MSVGGAGGGGEEVAAIKITVGVDDAAAQIEAQRLAQSVVKAGESASGQGISGFRAFGSAAVSSISGIIGQAEMLDKSFGRSNPLAPLMMGLQNSQAPLETFGRALDADATKVRNLELAAAGFHTVGAVIVGVAGMIAQVSTPLQNATAALTNSIANTTNAVTGQADDISNYKDQISGAEKAGAKWGYSADQVRQALAQLTEETRSAPEAFKELAFSETLAAAMSEKSTVSLSQAADLVGRMHAGLYRALRRFGIDIPSLLINPDKEATKAHNELATATTKLQTAENNLAAFRQQISAAEQARQEAWAAKVQDAEQKATAAQQRYQDSLQSAADAQQHMLDVSTASQQKISDNAQKLAQDTQSANQGVVDAQAKIQDLKQQWADQDAARAQSAQQQIQSTTQALTDAESSLQDLTGQWELTPARTAAQQLTRLDALRKAVENVQKAKDAQARAEQSGQLSATDQLSRQTAMHSAQEAFNKAIQKQHDLAREAADMQVQNTQAQVAASHAAEQYALAQQHVAAAQLASDNAARKLAQDQAAAATAGQPTAAESRRLGALEGSVATDEAGVAKAKKAVADAAAFQKQLDDQFKKAENEFLVREQGLPERRAHTLAGHIRTIEADIKNVVMNMSKDVVPLATLGLGLAGVGSVVSTASKIRQAIQKMRGGEDVAKDAEKSKGALKNVEKGAKDLEGGFGNLGKKKDALSDNFQQFGGKLADHQSVVGDTESAYEQLQLQFEQGGEKIATSGEKVAETGGKLSGFGREAEGLAGAVGKSGAMGEIATAGEGMAGAVAEGGAGVISGIGGILPAIMGPQALIIGAIAAIAAIGYVIYRNWGTISKALSKAWDWTFKEGKRIFGDLETFFKRWWPEILGIMTGGALLIPALLVQNWGTVKKDVAALWDDVKRLFKRGEDDVVHATGLFVGEIIKGFESITNGELIMIENMLQAASHLPLVGGKFKGLENDLKSFQSSMDSSMSSVADDMEAWGTTTGKNLGTGFTTALVAAQKDAAAAGAKLSGDTIKSMRLAAQTASPSRLTFKVGQDIARGAWMGMEDEKPKVDKSVSNLFDPTKLSSSSSLTPLRGGGGNTIVNFNVTVHVQGTVIAEHDLQQSLKTFLQRGAMQSGGLQRFLGINVGSSF